MEKTESSWITHAVYRITPHRKFSNYFISYLIKKYELYLTFSIIIIYTHRTEFETVRCMSCQTSDGRQLEMGLMRTASNSSLTQKYGDKTKHVSITVLIVLKLIGSPVLTQLRTGPKQCRFSIPIGKNRVPRGPPGPRGPHAIGWVAWCLNTLLCVGSRCAGKLDLASELEIEGESGGAPVKKNKHLFKLTTAGQKN